MKEVSAITVLQSVLKMALSVGLILFGFGVYGAVVGHVISYLIEGLLAGGAVYIARMRPWSNSNTVADIKTMVGFGLPLFSGSIISGLAAQYANVILATLAANTIVGDYQAAVNVTVAITLVSGSIANAMFRSFATLDGIRGDISVAFGYAVRYVSYILTPIAFFLIASAGVLFELLYGPTYSSGIILLKLVALSYLPVAFGLTILPSFLTGIGRNRFSMLISIAGAVSLVVASLILAVYLGLGAEGIMLSLLASNAATTGLGLFLSARYLGIRVAFKPLLGVVAAGLAGWLVVSVLPFGMLPDVYALVADCAVYLLVYITCAPLFSAIDIDDVARLSMAMTALGPLRGLLQPILNYERRVLSLVKREAKSAQQLSATS
jgi:O-antigen/teichoic acid export membrane protein